MIKGVKLSLSFFTFIITITITPFLKIKYFHLTNKKAPFSTIFITMDPNTFFNGNTL